MVHGEGQVQGEGDQHTRPRSAGRKDEAQGLLETPSMGEEAQLSCLIHKGPAQPGLGVGWGVGWGREQALNMSVRCRGVTVS